MYILHRPGNRQQRKQAIAIAALLVIGVGLGSYYGSQLLPTETIIGPQPAAAITHVSDNRKAPKIIDELSYSFQLPSDWEKFVANDAKPNSVSWRNTANNKGVRVVTVYMDASVQNMAVNRVLAVQPTGQGIAVSGDVSDNCVNFTNAGKPGAVSGNVPAKWQGVDFMCDNANYVRNVVGTSVPGSVNTIKLVSSSGIAHSVFMTYTDSSATPDFAIFTSMVQSFKLK